MLTKWPGSLITPLICVAVTIAVLVLTLSTSLGGYGADNIFAYHPTFMTIAFLLLMPLAMLSYVADIGDKGNSAYPDIDSRRLLHGSFGMLAALLVLCGYLVAFVYHEAKGIEHLALTQNYGTLTRPAHVFIGLIALAGVILQSSVGLYKFVIVTRDRRKSFKLHGAFGPFVWICGLVCIGLAAYFEYLEGFGHWSLGQASAIWVGLVVVFLAVMAHAHLGNRDHIAIPLRENADENEDYFVKRLIVS